MSQRQKDEKAPSPEAAAKEAVKAQVDLKAIDITKLAKRAANRDVNYGGGKSHIKPLPDQVELHKKLAALTAEVLLQTLPKFERGAPGKIVQYLVEQTPLVLDALVQQRSAWGPAEKAFLNEFSWEELSNAYEKRHVAGVFFHTATFVAACAEYHQTLLGLDSSAAAFKFIWRDAASILVKGGAQGGKEAFKNRFNTAWVAFKSAVINQIQQLAPPGTTISRADVAGFQTAPVDAVFADKISPLLLELWDNVIGGQLILLD